MHVECTYSSRGDTGVKSVKKIKEATVEELCEVDGINEALAKKILFNLN